MEHSDVAAVERPVCTLPHMCVKPGSARVPWSACSVSALTLLTVMALEEELVKRWNSSCSLFTCYLYLFAQTMYAKRIYSHQYVKEHLF